MTPTQLKTDIHEALNLLVKKHPGNSFIMIQYAPGSGGVDLTSNKPEDETRHILKEIGSHLRVEEQTIKLIKR